MSGHKIPVLPILPHFKVKFYLKLVRHISYCLYDDGHYVVSHNSVAVDPARVESLIKLRPPSSKAELRSILGSFLLCSYFVPNYAQTVGPLYELLRENVDFVWTQNPVFGVIWVTYNAIACVRASLTWSNTVD